MPLVVKDLDGHNPSIKLSHGSVRIFNMGGFIEVRHEDGGTSSQILTVPRGVEILGVP